jgi:hypothetical protein
MKMNISNIIEESLFNEVKRAIINENKDSKEMFQITCEGEPVESFESEEIAMKHLDIYKKKHPKKEFIIEKVKYGSPNEMIDKLDQMGEELEKNKETNKMKKTTVSGMAEAILSAKDKGLKEFKFNGKKYNVDESWSELEEKEMCEGGCGQGYMEEESDVEESNAFVLAADAAKDSGKEEFEFPKGSGKMHKVTIKKDIEVNEGKKTCSECGGMMNEEGICEGGCGSGRMEESKKTKLRLTESELVSLIKKMVVNSKKNLSEAIPGIEVTKKAQSGTKKDGDDAMKLVKDKLKKASSFDGNDNPEFPNQISKGDKMAVNPNKEEEEYIDDNMKGGTLLDLDYDFEPSEGFKKRLKMALEGDPTMGNSQDAANVIKTKTGENLSKSAERKKQKEKDTPEAFYGARGVQPLKVKTVNESKTTMTSIVNEEISRMKKIIGYDESTQ